MNSDSLNTLIDEFVRKTKALVGKDLSERECWNTVATQDAIRHFAYGISDDNPLWLNPGYAARTQAGQLLAPPAFLTSVLYPHLHGEPMEVPLANLIGDLEFHWYAPIVLGDSFRASAKIKGVFESKDRSGRRSVFIFSETAYRNQHDVMVGKALGTMVRYALGEKDLLSHREIYQYTAEELNGIGEAQKHEIRTGNRQWLDEDIRIGQELPPLVRGPLTIGDLICWQAAIGPSYRPGSLGYVDSLAAPHNAVTNPRTGWPVKYSQQHEDFLLASQRGMPAPFDNGVMRLAWISPLLTNWMGDSGTLTRLSIQILEPNLYGDTTWYRAVLTEKSYKNEGVSLKFNLTGTNQLQVVTTQGVAEVFLPLRPKTPSRLADQAKPEPRSLTQEGKGEECIHDILEGQAVQTPDRIALSCEEHSMTYGELHRRANQFASHLEARGVGPEVVVGIYLDRSLEVIVAMLAVLRAGGAFLVLDADYPQHRISLMVREAEMGVLITQEGHREIFVGYSGILVYVDQEAGKYWSSPQMSSLQIVSPNNLAYCMYTSGTTEVPKRVGVSHASLTTYIRSLKQAFPLHPNDCYLQTASLAFSASTRQIFLPLCSGATIHMATTQERQDPFKLYDLIARRQITVWDTVPSVWKNCGDVIFRERREIAHSINKNSLRLIFLTGEALERKTVIAWKRYVDESVEIVNLYSQTESAGSMSYHAVEQDEGSSEDKVPLGRPLSGIKMYLLDHECHLVDREKSGDIFVGGGRMARGYLNRPDLTAVRFIPDPYGGNPGGRLLRTGDVGCFDSNDTLNWKGRSDQQAKVRGFRLELGEIETLIRQNDRISEVLVLKWGQDEGESQVVAYVVPYRTEVITTEELRASLKPRLPDYMIPGSFVFLESMPRTPNGKVDRQALPSPDLPTANLETRYEAPQDDLETLLTGVWQEVFGKEPIGVHDDFYALGGHSLLATQVIVRLRERHKVDLPLRMIFEHPTVRKMAQALSAS